MGWKVLNRDRSFNVVIKGRQRTHDAYHSLLSATWPGFIGFVVLVYLSVNLIFATLFFAIGADQLQGITSEGLPRFLDCFFFSVQTVATIGYGHVSPIGLWSHLFVTLESLVGLIGLSVMAGLCFARVSRPSARVMFSRVALLTKVNGEPALVFRLANARMNQIAEASVSVVMVRNDETKEGVRSRKMIDLPLVRSRSPLFTLTWTVTHLIDQNSPLHGMDPDALTAVDGQIFVTLSGIDETMMATIHDRFSYNPGDLACDARFKDMMERTADGKISVDLSLIDQWEPIPSTT